MSALAIYTFSDFLLTQMQHLEMQTHRHRLIQLSIISQGEFVCQVQKKQVQAQAVLIQSDVPHHTPATNAVILNFLFDPQTPIGFGLQQRLANNSHLCFDFDLELHALNTMSQLPKEQILTLLKAILEQAGVQPQMVKHDSRIRQAVTELQELDYKQISTAKMAAKIGMSSSRFTHLFKNQVGSTLRGALLWLRFGEAVQLIWAGKNITEAAHEAGFADSAHLARASRTFLGRGLSAFFQSPKGYRVYDYT